MHLQTTASRLKSRSSSHVQYTLMVSELNEILLNFVKSFVFPLSHALWLFCCTVVWMIVLLMCTVPEMCLWWGVDNDCSLTDNLVHSQRCTSDP